MAFLDSINFDGKSIRDFLTEIIEVRGRGKPRIRKRSSRIIGRHGDFTFGQTYAPRIIRISGYVEGASHVTLMLNVDNIKNLFSMDDQILATGEESISDGVKYGKLVFGDETDRYYRAIYNGINVLTEISQRWFSNDLKRIQIELRCDDPFAYATSLSESTMAGSADEFKVFDLGTANNEVIIELSGSVTNPVIIEGDKVGVVHFDYNDDLTDVEVNTVAGGFEEIFGFRTRKSLTSQQSKAIQLVSKDNLFYDRGANINGQNYVNLNLNQITMIFWVKPYFDGDDGKTHYIFESDDNSTNRVFVRKASNSQLVIQAFLGGTNVSTVIVVNSSNFTAGKWHFIAVRWDNRNKIDGTNTLGLRLDAVNSEITTSLGTPNAVDEFIAFGQDYSTTPDGLKSLFDGLIHHQIFERALTDSELDDIFNSGAGVEPFVTPDTKLLSAGELSGGLPVSVQYPWVDNKFPDGGQEVDPAATWFDAGSVGSGANTAVTNETTIVKYDLQSAKLAWSGAASDEYTYLNTSALVDNQDYFYRISVYVEILNASDELHIDIVGSSTVHTRRLDTGTDDMGVAFATGKWLYFEGTFEADGVSGHQFRFRKVNANGNATVYVDQMDVQVNLGENTGMEVGGTVNVSLPTNYVVIGTPTTAVKANTASDGGAGKVHSGVFSIRIITDAINEGFKNEADKFTTVTNRWYRASIWVFPVSGTVEFDMGIRNGAATSSYIQVQTLVLGQWNLFTFTYKEIAGGSGAFFNFIRSIEATASEFYADDFSIIELDTVTANAASAPTSEIDSYSEEKFKQGLRIDGADILSWTIVGNKNEGSIEVWLRPQFAADWDDDTDDPTIYTFNNNSNNRLTLFYDWTTSQFIFRKRAVATDRNALSATQAFTKGQRLHIIGTWGTNLGTQIYVDGVAGTLSPSIAPLAGNPSALVMALSGGDIFPDSIIDELYVYSRELSAQEVTAQFNAFKATKNDNAKISMTKVLNTSDKLRIDTENEVIEFLDSSAGTFTNAIASMNAGSVFFKMNQNKSVIYNKVAITNVSVINKIKLNYLKRFL